MKKALIIASCGLILALIIGAASKPTSLPGQEAPSILEGYKCHDASNYKNSSSECMGADGIPSVRHAEKFLRDVKRKVRLLYA